jgi:hypothetical protein
MEWFFSMTMPDHTHCKHEESGHSWKRLGDSSTSTLLSGHYPIITTSSALSPTVCAEFPSTTTLSSKIDSTTSSRPNQRTSPSVGSKTALTLGGSRE